MANVLYEDKWGMIIDRPDADSIEIRWFDRTGDMNGDDFNGFLSVYADLVFALKRGGCLVDATSFRMPMERMSMGWRDENIIPRYNAAGVKKFAFHMNEGMPAIGKAPEKEGPAEFPTAYFATRVDATNWLKAS